MANAFAPNHGTTIDKVVHKSIRVSWPSMNLAELGACSTSEMIRLLLEVLTLKLDIVVSLDAYREYSVIQYSGGGAE